MRLFLFLSVFFAVQLCSAQHKYEIDLTTINKDEVVVKYTPQSKPKEDVTRFSFPATVPGTYATQDYGKYVTSFSAYDAAGKKLPAKKEGNNTWVISKSKELGHIVYSVQDAMDMQVKKDKIFEPASTNFMAGKLFFFNNGGIFGFEEGRENEPLNVEIKKPADLYGATSLPRIKDDLQQLHVKARNYHQLVDCPMMFSPADTAQFFVNKTKVTISVYDVQGEKRARKFYDALKRDMEAIAKFLPELPVDNYTFIIFVDDLREVGQALTGKMGLFKKIKLAKKFGNLGIGALEHGNSSTYYLGDFGPELDIEDLSLEGQLTGAAIHEFMHIVTPLGLHSQHIGNFNYTKPVMSKHLWLYEGITEYFAHLVKYKGGVYTPDQYLKEMGYKFSSGVSFPIHEMSFTEMSANVLQPQYEKHYGQVYQRGAALGMLLDAEIQRLTKGEKELIDVILTLVNRYGAEKSFDEEGFIDEFVAEVHPDLKQFFSLYIEGKNQWKPNDQLIGMNVIYHDTLKENALLNPLSPYENEIRTANEKGGLVIVVTQVGAGEYAGFKPGDKVDAIEFSKAMKKSNGDPVDEGQEVIIKVIRDGQPKKLMFKARYGMKTRTHVLKWIK